MRIATFVRRKTAACTLLATLSAAAFAPGADRQPDNQPHTQAINRTIAYLSTEVTWWNEKHTCYSCHNNGDAIRALLISRQAGYAVDSKELQETIDWLRRPGEWSDNGPDGEFNDRRLAQLQFSSALATAELKQESDHRPLRIAAGMVASNLQPNGMWPSDQIGTIGSPITLGPFLATAQARNVLRQADLRGFTEVVDRANRWLRGSNPKSVLNAAAVLWALAHDAEPAAAVARAHCRDLIRRGQSDVGGWGAYVSSATEPFDTAIVILALHADDDKDQTKMIDKGLDFLIKTQLPDGSWPETTRPANRESYAHRISTTAWCLQAIVTVTNK